MNGIVEYETLRKHGKLQENVQDENKAETAAKYLPVCQSITIKRERGGQEWKCHVFALPYLENPSLAM